MEVRFYPFGPLQAILYLVVIGKEAIIIDPCVPVELLDLDGLDVKGIICTHAHYDHIIEADNISRKTKSVLLAYTDEIPLMKDSIRNGSARMFLPYSVESPVLPLKDGDILTPRDFMMSDTEPFTIKVIHTPGHTYGSISVLFDFFEKKKNGKHLFTGDTVFAGMIGRTDLGGDMNQMKQSIAKIAMLEDDVIIYPGHGEMTTVGAEKRHNQFFTAAFYNDII
ncbi:MAG: MBL fold metallo-hydrolase [Oscillospiraceae bacterium]|nr:MBL fold metallo-hydrolase [Oscillospiraceae bacterium]